MSIESETSVFPHKKRGTLDKLRVAELFSPSTNIFSVPPFICQRQNLVLISIKNPDSPLTYQ